jgi:hypothetical protein
VKQLEKTKPKKKKLQQVRYNLSEFYKDKKFDDFKELRKFIVEFMSLEKEAFIKFVLEKNGIKTDDKLSKKEIYQILKDNDIIFEVKDKTTIIKKGEKKIGEWSDDYSLDFKNGNLNLLIRYK